ncbi:MAG: class I SAM-dependent methyltransferase [Anaerolineales bacterium]
MLAKFLAHPLTRGLDIDAPETTRLRRRIINSKPFLRRIYEEWYAMILEETGEQNTSGPTLELGSGAGFFSAVSPGLISSDLFAINGISLVMDAQHFPFKDGSLNALAMINVLHHIPDPERLFAEAARCTKKDGKFILIEPWLTTWSRFVYKRLHHEPVNETSADWNIQGEGPLTGANTALPWIIFQRDRALFESKFKMWRIAETTPFMPFRYLLSGGISLRSLMFSSSFVFWRGVENLLKPWKTKLGMFAKIVLVRQEIT